MHEISKYKMCFQSSPECQQLIDAHQSWGFIDGEEAPPCLLIQPGAWTCGLDLGPLITATCPAARTPHRPGTVLPSPGPPTCI